MGKSCTILAHVRRDNGEIVESKLFNDLLHYTANNRELSKEYYAVGTNEEFLSKVRDSKEFQTDENGEITFKSLRSLANMDLEADKLVQVLNKDIGQGEYSYDEAIRRIQEFNTNNSWSDKMLATMVSSGNGKYFISVVPKVKKVTSIEGKEREEVNTSSEQKKLHDVVRNEELERKIKALLRRHHVSVKFLEGDRQGGRYSTENASKMEDGLYGLIEVINNGYVSDVLAEEAGHFAVGALGENPLVERLETLLKTNSAQKEALGEEEYDNAALGSNPAREVAGRLVGKALKKQLNGTTPFMVLANRVANLAKRVFYNFTGNEVRWAAAKAEQIANKIAYQFIEGDSKFSVENAISIKEKMYDAHLTMNQKVYRDTMDELGRMVNRLKVIAQDQFTGKMQKSFSMSIIAGTDHSTGQSALQMKDSIADTFAFDGIVQALVQITDYLGPGKEIDQLLKAVNLDNPSEFYANMARNGKYLRQARTFLRSSEIIVQIIEDALDKNHLGGSIVLANGSTIHDVKYQDENGTWRSIDMTYALSSYRDIIAAAKSELTALEGSYFARFCEDIYGSKYITSSTGVLWSNIWQGTEVLGEQSKSIASMISGEGMEDIDIFHRYIGSMSNNPDVIGQIADKLVKSANKAADDRALQVQEELMILGERAKRLNLDLADLVERDENGIPTGNIITPPVAPTQEGNREQDFICKAYLEVLKTDDVSAIPPVNHGMWEKKREEFKKSIWENFKRDNPDLDTLSGFTKGYKWDQYYRKEYKDWNESNSVKVEITDENGNVLYVKWEPNPIIYQDSRWYELSRKYPDVNGDSLRQWVHDYLKIKEEMDALLPLGSTTSYRLPQFRGTFMNSVRNSMPLEKGKFKGTKAAVRTFGRRSILETFVETSEDSDYGDMLTMNSLEEELLGNKLNYEEERPQRLPVFGINKLNNMQDLSTDLLHSMLAYASMATTYSALSDAVDALEVGREALYNRNIRGKSSILDKGINLAKSIKVGNRHKKASGPYEAYETGSKNRAYGRYTKFLDKQVYGITATHWGITTKDGKRFLLNKAVQFISSLGGTLFLKGNVPGGAVNTMTGFFNVFKEAVTGDYFTAKDWAKAHQYYFSHFFQMWTSDVGKLRKENKLDLFLEHMNALSDNKTKFRNWHTSRNRLNNFYRMVGYLPYSSGDHYMQAMSYLSVAHGTKLYSANGRGVTTLWDAYKKVDNEDTNGSGITSGKSLEFAGFCPTDARQITSSLLRDKGAYLKSEPKSTKDFESWLVWQDAAFADDVYKRNNAREYNNYRDTYDNLSAEDLMKFKQEKYDLLTSILQKTEDYLGSASPLMSVPVFSTKEQEYLSTKGVGTGNYADILQVVKDDIYGIIWTGADESSYMDKCREVNIRLHGIYNEQDKTAWHQQWYTNAFLAMKGWALGYLEMMYSPNHYSVALGKDVEGFVNTAAKLPIYTILNSLRGRHEFGWKDLAITMIAPWSDRSMKAMKKGGFSEEQNYNARRMFSSVLLMGLLYVLRVATAKGDGDGDDDEEEYDQTTGLIHYFAMRTLLEQEALLYVPETFVQTGQLLDFTPVGFAALYDLGNLVYQTAGAAVSNETDKDFYYQRADRNGRYEKYDTKAYHHFIRLVPYWKSWWALTHPYEATDNYEFGRKLRTR